MQRTIRRVVTAFAAMLLASGLAAAVNPAAANAGSNLIPGGSCYAGAFSTWTQNVNYVNGNPVSYYTATFRTPSYYSCHDINVSGVTANGGTVATMMRVHYGYFNAPAAGWHWVASGWVVLAYNYCRGCNYTIEAWKVSPNFGPVDFLIAA